jgi:hypothetical protein
MNYVLHSARPYWIASVKYQSSSFKCQGYSTSQYLSEKFSSHSIPSSCLSYHHIQLPTDAIPGALGIAVSRFFFLLCCLLPILHLGHHSASTFQVFPPPFMLYVHCTMASGSTMGFKSSRQPIGIHSLPIST